MIIIAGTVQIDPAQRAEAIERARTVAAASEQEPGCRAYRITADLAATERFHIFELWDDEAALTAHFQTPHLQVFQQHMTRFVVGPMAITRFDVVGAADLS